MTRANYKRIGLTGGIGAGKTTVSGYFSALGVPVVCADEIARDALQKEGACYRRVIETFGEAVLCGDGTIDRKKLADIVFSNEEKRRMLNDIVHPYVRETMFDQANAMQAKNGSGIVLFDVPLLFESGMDKDMDANILVVCNEETRIRRIMERDGMTRASAEARIRSQMPEDEKQPLTDFILENHSTQSNLEKQVEALYKKLTESVHAADAESTEQ